jgi:hypothetical protein
MIHSFLDPEYKHSTFDSPTTISDDVLGGAACGVVQGDVQGVTGVGVSVV